MTTTARRRKSPAALDARAQALARRSAAAFRLMLGVPSNDNATPPPPARWWHGCKMSALECDVCSEHYLAAAGGRR